MSVSKFTSSTGLNDFNLNIQAINSTIIFDAEKSQGSYSIASSSNDTSIDFYAYASDGSLAGYTGNKSFTASRNFNKMVILGGTIGDVIGFTYKTTYATSQETAETTAGPFITAVSPSSLPNVNSTTTVSGGNFASGITATFYGSDANTYPAKSVVVGSPQSLIVTRPDVFPVSANPYTLKVLNPGVADPVGSAVNVLSNGITAGNAPVWTTAAGSIGTFNKNVPFSATVVATDSTDSGSALTYSVAPGYSLPAGLSLGSSTGIISGTPTISSPVTSSFYLRVTDTGGNYVDRLFTLSDSGPVWITTTLPSYVPGSAYSQQLSATDDSGTAPTYALFSGTLPTGFTLSSSGLLSGTSFTSGTSTITISATDTNGTSSNQTFSVPGLTLYSNVYTTNTTFTTPSYTVYSPTGVANQIEALAVAGGGGTQGPYSGGAGAGGAIYTASYPVSPNTGYTVTVGGGGSGAANGGNSVFGNMTAYGGGYGGYSGNGTGSNGGCGGGGRASSGSTPGGASTQTSNGSGTGYGTSGGTGGNGGPYMGGGGGGTGGAGQTGQPQGTGYGGVGQTLAGRTFGGGGGGWSSPGSYGGTSAHGYGGGNNSAYGGGNGGGGNNGDNSQWSPTGGTNGTGGGAGGDGSGSQSGGSGVVVVRYYA